MVWELSRAGELVTPFNNTPLAAANWLLSIYLVRHRRNHFNNVVFEHQKFPLARSEEIKLKSCIRDARVSSAGSSSSNNSVFTAASALSGDGGLGGPTSSPSLEITV